jgi:hypothetical protein
MLCLATVERGTAPPGSTVQAAPGSLETTRLRGWLPNGDQTSGFHEFTPIHLYVYYGIRFFFNAQATELTSTDH